MSVDPGAIAGAFALGRPRSPLVPVSGGSSAGRWLLDTDLGRWLVKTLPSPQDWRLRAMRVSATLERAAAAAKVAMPAPAEPRGDAVGYWTRLDDGDFARVSAWVDVTGPTVVDAELAAWVGATLAKIERLDLPGDPSAEAAYPVHAVSDWENWLPAAIRAGVLTGEQAGRLLSIVAEATHRVHAEFPAGPAFRLAHRDVSGNILRTAEGPVLVDFDHAGPEIPWWEVLHQIFDLAWHPGHDRPRPAIVNAAIGGFLNAGGTPGPASRAAFTGMLSGTLGSLAYNLWLSAGLRPCAPERRTSAAGIVGDATAKLAVVLRSAENWAVRLGGVIAASDPGRR